ncbi:hypothetical protein FOCC_FOCC008640 [Frankliniella occidentalis]|nr:hypothetical protein FOCC_FOCC008640 [Frankliniella occidentalis]
MHQVLRRVPQGGAAAHVHGGGRRAGHGAHGVGGVAPVRVAALRAAGRGPGRGRHGLGGGRLAGRARRRVEPHHVPARVVLPGQLLDAAHPVAGLRVHALRAQRVVRQDAVRVRAGAPERHLPGAGHAGRGRARPVLLPARVLPLRAALQVAPRAAPARAPAERVPPRAHDEQCGQAAGTTPMRNIESTSRRRRFDPGIVFTPICRCSILIDVLSTSSAKNGVLISHGERC